MNLHALSDFIHPPPKPALRASPVSRVPGKANRLSAVPLLPRAAMDLVPCLAGVDDGTLNALARHARVRWVRKGECLGLQGQTPTHMSILIRGRAHAERQSGARNSVLLALLRPGDTMGELSLLDAQPNTATVRAVQNCLVLDIDHGGLFDALAWSAELRHALTLVMTGRLRQANQRIRLMALHPVRDRVMLQLQAWAVAQADGSWLVVSDASRTELAGLIGASREMVSRAVQRLRSAGQIEQRSSRTLVLHPAAAAGSVCAPA